MVFDVAGEKLSPFTNPETPVDPHDRMCLAEKGVYGITPGEGDCGDFAGRIEIPPPSKMRLSFRVRSEAK